MGEIEGELSDYERLKSSINRGAEEEEDGVIGGGKATLVEVCVLFCN